MRQGQVGAGPGLSSPFPFHLALAAGLAPAASLEARRIGLSPVEESASLVRFEGSLADGVRAVLGLRSAPRVVLELARGIPPEPEALAEAVRQIPWEDLLPRRQSFAVRASGRSPALRHSLFVAQLTKDAIRDRFGAFGWEAPPVDPENPGVLIDISIFRKETAVGLDLAGGSLHRRGTDRHGPAPLREDVAAGIALLAEIDPEQPLVDPCCGTGTLIAEAAAVASRIPPRRDSSQLGFSRLPLFRSVDVRQIAEELAAAARPAQAPILAFDRDPRAVRQTRQVLSRLGLERMVEVQVGAIQELALPAALGPGLLIGNPPWGLRFEPEDAEKAWYALGTLARRALSGWRLALLSGNPQVTRQLGLRAERRIPVGVGGIDARLLIYQMR